MKNEISFETIIRDSKKIEITDIRVKDNITYFKINGHQFGTYDNKIFHRDSWMFNHPLTKIWVEQTHDPEKIVEYDEMVDSINKDLDLWFKHRLAVYKIVFIRAMELLATHGDDAFLEFIEEHFSIQGEDKTKALIARLEKDE